MQQIHPCLFVLCASAGQWELIQILSCPLYYSMCCCSGFLSACLKAGNQSIN